MLILHGTADPLVPYHQSVELDAKLRAAGVKTQFITIEDGGHGGFPDAKNQEFNGTVEKFLRDLGIFDPQHSY